MAFISPNVAVGGMGKMTMALATASAEAGHKTTVITLYSGSEPFQPKYEYINLALEPTANPIAKISLNLKRIFGIAKNLNRLAPEIIFCIDPISFLGTLCYKLFSRDGIKIGFGCFVPLQMLKPIDLFVLKLLARFCDVFFVPSNKYKSDFEKKFGDIEGKIRKVRCPLSLESLSCNITRPSDQQKIDFQYLGRFSAEKNPNEFIDIAERNSSFSFRMNGGGPLLSEILERVSKSNIRNLTIDGFMLPKNVLPQSKILILTSLYETFGMVIPEAWLHGMQIIAGATTDGPAELISNYGHGFLVDFKNTSLVDSYLKDSVGVQINPVFEREILELFAPSSVFDEWIDLIIKI